MTSATNTPSARTKRRHKRNAAAVPYSDAPLPWNNRAETEIQRLRTAMVHAMDDCGQALLDKHLPVSARTVIDRARMELKTALEKK